MYIINKTVYFPVSLYLYVCLCMNVDLARRKAKELARGNCVPIDSHKVFKSLSSEGEMVKEHMLRLKKVCMYVDISISFSSQQSIYLCVYLIQIKGSFGKGRIPTEEAFDKDCADIQDQSRSSIVASKQSSTRVLDQWKSNLENSRELAKKNTQEVKDRGETACIYSCIQQV